jgi:hypothetical protein
MVLCLTTAKFKLLIFAMSGFTLSYTANMFILMTLYESQSELLYYWRFTANQFVFATSPLRLTTSNFIFKLNAYGYSPYVTSSLNGGWVCRLQLLLVLASAVILTSDSRGTIFYCHRLGDSPNLEGKVPVFTSPRNWVPFSSPPTTRRATVEVFDPGSTRVYYATMAAYIVPARTALKELLLTVIPLLRVS